MLKISLVGLILILAIAVMACDDQNSSSGTTPGALTLPAVDIHEITSRLVETIAPVPVDELDEPVAATEPTPEIPPEDLIATPKQTPETTFEERLASLEPTPSIGSLGIITLARAKVGFCR